MRLEKHHHDRMDLLHQWLIWLSCIEVLQCDAFSIKITRKRKLIYFVIDFSHKRVTKLWNSYNEKVVILENLKY